jgi:hypothetical protein
LRPGAFKLWVNWIHRPVQPPTADGVLQRARGVRLEVVRPNPVLPHRAAQHRGVAAQIEFEAANFANRDISHIRFKG